MSTEKKSDWTFRFLLSLGASAMVALPLLTGCVTGDAPGTGDPDPFQPGTNPGTDDDDDDDVTDDGTTFLGVVRDAMGDPLDGVNVTTSTGITAVTDHQGRYNLDMTEDDAGVVQVSFIKSGYARSHTPFEILANLDNFLMQTMAEVDLVRTFAAGDAQDLAIDHEGKTLSIQLPGSNFIDESGAAYDGDVTVEATFYDLTSEPDLGLEIFAAPGDFTAVAADGSDKRLESFGMIQVNLMGSDGQELNLDDEGAAILMPIQDLGSQPVLGETVTAWSYDTDTGKWIEEGFGTVVDVDGDLFWEFTANHFSTWNCDRPISTHGCLSGQITTSQGEPRSGATIRAVGQTYISTTTARTDGNGDFCLEVKNGETVWVEISYAVGGQPATQRTDPVTIPSGQGTCYDGDVSDCVDLGVIPVDIMSCVNGVVIDGQNNPVVGADIVSPQGGIAVTDNDGMFCLSVPVFQTTQVFVQTNIDSIGYQPIEVYTQPGTPNCQGGCANIAILRPFTETTCTEGAVIINNQFAANIPVQVFDTAFPEIAVFTTLSLSDGSFCAQVPVTGEVAIQVGAGDTLCGREVIDTSNLGGEVCDESSQSECLNIPDIVCSL